MKMTKTLVLAALVAGSLCAAGTLQAQDAPKGKPPGGAPGMRGTQGFEMMAKQLDLTEDQKPKVKAIMEDMAQKMRDLLADTSVAKADKATKAKEHREAANAKLKEVLTAEQYAKWETMTHRGRPAAAPEAKNKAPKTE
jgi:Spy/CpxP family protein refolding chaperone